MGKYYNAHIEDRDTLSAITYGFRLVKQSMARGIHVSFPNTTINEHDVNKAFNDAVLKTVNKNETSLITRPNSTNCRVHSCSAVTKKRCI